ncbi:MAG: ABC transporter ATP-binding protein/permease [Defluviitaleaceae bacterium]|nr:ABC transporter ATP-binding protein/permease [Defluviitaleaceae bacterium]
MKERMKYLKKTYGFMRPYMFLYLLGMLFYNGQQFMVNYIIGLFGRNTMDGIVARDASEVFWGMVTAFLFLVGAGALIAFGIYVSGRATVYADRDLRKKLFNKFVNSSLEASQSGHSGEGIAAINTDAGTTTDIYMDHMSNFLRPAITIILSIGTIFIIDWRMGLVSVGLGLIAYAAQAGFVKPLAKIGKERLNANADAVKSVSDVFQGAISIRAFNMQDKAAANADISINRLRLLRFREAFIGMWQDMFTTVQGWLSLVAVFGFGGWLVATDRGIEFPTLLLILPLLQGVAHSIGAVGGAWAGLQPPLEASKRVFNIIDGKTVKHSGNKKSFTGSSIKISNMWFKYKDAATNALTDITLEIKPGEMVAFIGPSGSGKSTLLRAIIGFYEREDLGISIGDTAFNDADITAWRGNFAYVDQSCKLFDMTIKENIALGMINSEAESDQTTDERIVSAAKRAFAHGFIEQLENGYDTPCGEKGASLSGGQKQRIAIARALIKSAPILVFDEATSALDADSERYVMETIESLREEHNHTILITSHNPDTVVDADRIVVMEAGRIVEIKKNISITEETKDSSISEE